MSSDNKSIHEFKFQMNLIHEYFSGFERQGPGSPEMTIKALSFIENLDAQSHIADIGCGTGGQTIVIAQNSPGRIIGVDLSSAFISLFNRNAVSHNLQDRMKGVTGSMDSLSFENGELDLIWSEGAIYGIGFERGINEWRRFLKSGGYIAVTEASWFTQERPREIEEFWQGAYPEIDTIPRKVTQMQEAGYIPVATFVLPDSCWLDYYAPHREVQEKFLKKNAGNEFAENFVRYQRYEEELYRKYKEYYGYVFYIGKKVGN